MCIATESGRVLLAAALALAAGGARASDGGHAAAAEPPCHGSHAGHAAPAEPAGGGHAGAPAAGDAAAVQLALPDAPLVDQHGRPVRLVGGVLRDRIVVVGFVFTTCTTVCPVLSAIMRRVQDRLGDALGEDVAIVSVTVDPIRDTPERLLAYARKHGAGPDWTWLTGTTHDVETVLRAAGAYTPRFQDHPPMVLVGDARSGEWSRMNGFPSDERIASRVAELLRKRATTASAGEAR